MKLRFTFMVAIAIVGLIFEQPTGCLAQTQVLSSEPPNVEYQYQMYYPRWYGWPGPGLSLGGSLPSRGREGLSSFYGTPLPVPLGAGVYVNPFAYSARLPGPFAFGLASSAAPTTATPGSYAQPMQQAGANPFPPPGPTIQPANAVVNPIQRPVSTSSPETVERSRAIESFGDESWKHQQWIQAYVNYRNAVEIADDRAEAHARLGFACLVLKKFPEAAREFKRALTIDPAMAQSGETLETVFGPENQGIRAELTRGVAQWTKEDLKDQDRLFLMGVVLHYSQDPRAGEILEAAYRITGSGDHLMALLTPVPPSLAQLPVGQVSAPSLATPPAEIPPAPTPQPPELMQLPPLHQQPLALQQPSR